MFSAPAYLSVEQLGIPAYDLGAAGMRIQPSFQQLGGLPMPAYDPLKAGVASRSQRFSFRQRTARMNWRVIHSLDIDRIKREGDVDFIQEHFANFSVEDLGSVTSDECVAKLVQMMQLGLEFLYA